MNDATKCPATIEEMLRTPGVYQVSIKGSPYFVRVEVSDDLVCYQLTPNLFRDGVLSPDGWLLSGKEYEIQWVAKL